VALFGDHFGFRRGTGSRDAIGMLRIIPQRTLDIKEELYECSIDWQKAFERINWTKLQQIIKGNCVEWREKGLISKVYVVQSVKLKLEQGETRSVKNGRSCTRMLFITDSIQLVQRIPYQGSS